MSDEANGTEETGAEENGAEEAQGQAEADDKTPRDRMEDGIMKTFERVPVLEDTGIKRIVNGAIPRCSSTRTHG